MKSSYEVVTEVVTCHHNQGSDTGHWSSDYHTTKHGSYNEALKVFKDVVADNSQQKEEVYLFKCDGNPDNIKTLKRWSA